jgi:hypothetical protein
MVVRDNENVPAGSGKRGTSGEEYHEMETRWYVYVEAIGIPTTRTSRDSGEANRKYLRDY